MYTSAEITQTLGKEWLLFLDSMKALVVLKQKSMKIWSISFHLPLNHTAKSSVFPTTTDDIRLIKPTDTIQLTLNLMGLFIITAKFFCVSCLLHMSILSLCEKSLWHFSRRHLLYMSSGWLFLKPWVSCLTFFSSKCQNWLKHMIS